LHHRCRFRNRQRHSFSLLISESAATHFGCRFLNRQRRSFAVNFWIGTDTVWLSMHESAAPQFSLSISESTATQFLVADFWIGSNTIKT
jgi:hypothetical protein